MDPSPSECGAGGRSTPAWMWIAVFLVVCLGPYVGRLQHPSLYADDVVRVAELQTTPLRGMLFRPFNEHMAPVFQAVSWLTWQLAGGRLVNAPTAFTLASYVPFVLVLGLLGGLVRAETGSLATALASLALFSLTWVHDETVYWYSASSFMWALAFALVAWRGAALACERGSRLGGLATALAVALAPACSAIGLLAAPLAMTRALAPAVSPGRRRRLAVAIAAASGLLLYLAACFGHRYHQVLSDHIHQNVDPGAGLLAVARASTTVLVPALVGLPALGRSGSPVPALAAFVVGLVAVLLWARRSPDRHLILGGLVMILGGYGLTYCARDVRGSAQVLMTQRYHLFPQLGLVLIAAAALRPRPVRLERRPVVGPAAATALAVVLLAIHAPEMRARGRFYRHPDQGQTLAALDRLAAICAEQRVSRVQALAALDPIQTKWSPRDHNALSMLAMTRDAKEVPDPAVRSRLLVALTPAERRALCAGMDASPYLLPADGLGHAAPAAVGHLVSSFRVRAEGGGRYVSAGWPSYLEFEIPEAVGADRLSPSPTGTGVLALSGTVPGTSIELWWRGEKGRWSETRSVRWRTDLAGPGRTWALATGRLPHWDPAEVRRVRVMFRTAGPVQIEAPRVFR